jgi:hypothetical protein
MQHIWACICGHRALCGSEDQHRIFVTNYEAGEDGPQTYEGDTGEVKRTHPESFRQCTRANPVTVTGANSRK